MKPIPLSVLVACSSMFFAGCDSKSKSNPDGADRLAEAERRAEEALSRQQELERQLEEQRLAAERDAIERERMEIEQTRIALEQAQADAAAADAEKLRQRELELARREDDAAAREFELNQHASTLDQRGAELSDRERELAGREAFDNGNNTQQQPGPPVADYGMFYDSLSGYGSWFHTADYGYVWQPVVVRQVAGWRPYTRGRWVCTNYGWTWMSHEPFGWATYHYGRWALLRSVGWVWVPGSVWAPAWVTWRSGDSQIGWAPLPPETLAWRSNRWDSTVEVTFGIGAGWFNFVEYRHFGGSIHTHCLPYQRNPVFIQQTTNITHIHVHNGRVVNGGPRYDEISRKAGRRPPFYRLDLDQHSRPGRDSSTMGPRIEGDRLHIAAPNVDAEWNPALSPRRVQKRLERVEVERSQELRPEVAEQFRKSRRDSRERAERVIQQTGSRETFNQRRLEILQANRRDAAARPPSPPREQPESLESEASSSQPVPAVDSAPEVATTPPPAPQEAAKPRGRLQRPGMGGRIPSRQPRPEPKSTETAPTTQELPPASQETLPTTQETPPSSTAEPSRPALSRPGGDFRDRVRKNHRQQQEARQQEEQSLREQQRQSEEQARIAEEAAERQQAEAKQQEMAQREQQRQADEQSRREAEESQRQQMEEARRQQEQALREQQRMAEEQARREAEEAQRQQRQAEEQARREAEASQRQQMEEARRQQEQAIREQQEAMRQQEEMRRQQIEDSRRQQQQQQMEEQMRRQQQEEQLRRQQIQEQSGQQ